MTEKIVSTMEAVVPEPVEKVWAIVTDLDNWQWRSDLESLEQTGPDTFTEYGKGGFPTRFTVTRTDPLTRWEFDMENANMRGHWSGVFRTVPAGTEVVFTEQVTAKKWIMRPFVKAYLQKQQARYLADLKRALEARGE